MQVIVMTSDAQQARTIPAFWYLWSKYFHGLHHTRITCGFTHFDCDSHFYSIGNYSDYPVNKWSDALIKVLDNVADEVFLLMLDDYWLIRQVDTEAIRMMYDYMHQYQNVLKMDITHERLFAEGGGKYLFGNHTYDRLGYLDLIKSNYQSPYHMSLWGGLWRKDLLRSILIPSESAQDIEIAGTRRLIEFEDKMLVLGTRQAPLLHANVIQRGDWSEDETVGLPAIRDKEQLKKLGYLE